MNPHESEGNKNNLRIIDVRELTVKEKDLWAISKYSNSEFQLIATGIFDDQYFSEER